MAKGDGGGISGGVANPMRPMAQGQAMPPGLSNPNASPIGAYNKEEVLAKLMAGLSANRGPAMGMPPRMAEPMQPMPMPIAGPSGPPDKFTGGPMERPALANAEGMKSGGSMGPSNLAAILQMLSQRRA